MVGQTVVCDSLLGSYVEKNSISKLLAHIGEHSNSLLLLYSSIQNTLVHNLKRLLVTFMLLIKKIQ